MTALFVDTPARFGYLPAGPRHGGALIAMALIDFLVAGVQKCGTSALHAYLSKHPDIGMSEPKEVHFFDRESDVDWSRPDYGLLHRHFDFSAAKRVYGEATPISIFWQPAHERIATYNPKMKLILIFRDPVVRAFSNWCMEFARGHETLPFSEAIRGGRARIDAHRWSSEKRFFAYVERGYYARQLEQLLRLFPREQMLFLRALDLSRNPAQSLSTVCAFLGVDPFPHLPAPLRSNARPQVSYPSTLTLSDISYLDSLFRADEREFAELAQLDTATWQECARQHDGGAPAQP